VVVEVGDDEGMRTPIRTLAAVAVLTAVLTACGGTESESTATEPASTQSTSPTPTAEPPEQTTSAEPSPAAGRVVAWEDFEADPSAYADSDVVLYFHADWCSECQATDAALESDGIPAGLTLVKIDYDERTDLRQDYGVTVQHTFVLVDEDGERVDAWTDTTSGAEIADRAA
jgi:thiol-disulfide isomerase/thioredoxin